MAADQGWLEAYDDLHDLHVEKASTYGTDEDALANYVEASAVADLPAEFTPWLRIVEKAARAVNMIRQGRGDECEEAMDVAALALGAEALRRRRL